MGKEKESAPPPPRPVPQSGTCPNAGSKATGWLPPTPQDHPPTLGRPHMAKLPCSLLCSSLCLGCPPPLSAWQYLIPLRPYSSVTSFPSSPKQK